MSGIDCGVKSCECCTIDFVPRIAAQRFCSPRCRSSLGLNRRKSLRGSLGLCLGCGINEPAPRLNRRKRANCSECISKALARVVVGRVLPSKTPERAREYHLRHRYGMTVEQWDALFATQGGVCAVCRSIDPRHVHGWATDHDHLTGRIRGILCQPCNVTLGRLGDSLAAVTERAAGFAKYLAGRATS